MSNFYNSSIIFVFGLAFLFYAWIRIRSFITKRPFLYSAKWVYAVALCFIPLILKDHSFQLQIEGIALVCISLFFIFFRKWQTYYVSGVTNESMRAALPYVLKKLDIGYDDTSGPIKLSSGGVIAPVYGVMGRGCTMIMARNVQDKDLLKDIVAELNLHFQANPTATNTVWPMVNLVLMGFLLLCILVPFMPSLAPSYFHSAKPAGIDRADYIVYIPASLDHRTKHPLVIALSPSGNAKEMIDAWKDTADKFQWIVLASKKFHNGIDWPIEYEIFRKISLDVNLAGLPVDKRMIIGTGISGGAWGMHQFVYFFPDLISGIVVNTGMMDDTFSPAHRSTYPKGKFAVFLASPTDFRYREMQHDRDFLNSLGWHTKWIEFPGGHTFAPPASYFEAAEWVKEQLQK